MSNITFDMIAAEMQDLSISHERFIQLSHMLNNSISSHRTAFDPVYNTQEIGLDGRYIDDLLLTDEFEGRAIWGRPEKKCECGAKFTSRPNYHLDWCPLYEKK